MPRQHSVIAATDPRNVTSYHPDQENWDIDNLPDILYVFKPPVPDVRPEEPPMMSYPIHGQYLREIPVLPDNISSNVEEFRVEAWMRLDRRIRLCDITNRMHPMFRIKPNALQQRGVRFRKAFSMLAWGSGNKKTAELEAELVNAMIQKGIDPALNSTRGLTPGLINPELGEAGGRIPVPAQYARKQSISKPIIQPSVERSMATEEYSSDESMSDTSSEYSEKSSEVACDDASVKTDPVNPHSDADYIALRESERRFLEILGATECTPPSSPMASPQTPIAVVDPRDLEIPCFSPENAFVRRLSVDSEDGALYNDRNMEGYLDKAFEPPTPTLAPTRSPVCRFVDTEIFSPDLENAFAPSECSQEMESTAETESICSVLEDGIEGAESSVSFEVMVQEYYLGERALAELLP